MHRGDRPKVYQPRRAGPQVSLRSRRHAAARQVEPSPCDDLSGNSLSSGGGTLRVRSDSGRSCWYTTSHNHPALGKKVCNQAPVAEVLRHGVGLPARAARVKYIRVFFTRAAAGRPTPIKHQLRRTFGCPAGRQSIGRPDYGLWARGGARNPLRKFSSHSSVLVGGVGQRRSCALGW